MSVINTLDSLRFYEFGPILKHLNSEVEIKNIYRILRVLQPLIESLAARGGLLNISIESVGAGTSLIHDNTLPDWFLRSLVAGTSITITTSADGKEITIASFGAGTHELSDGAVHTDVAGSATPSEVNGQEDDGSILSYDNADDRWELSRIQNNDVNDDTVGPDYRVGPYRGFEAGVANFGPNSVIGGLHRMRMIASVNGSFIKLAKQPTTEDIQIAFDKTNFNLEDVNDVFYDGTPANNDLLVQDAAGRWRNIKPRLQNVMSDVTVSSIAVGELLVNTQAVVPIWENKTLSEAGIIAAAGSVPLTADWDVGAFKVTAQQLAADIADGTAPLIVTSTTKVANLNAETMDAAGTARDWDTVEFTRQIFMARVVTVGASEGWVTGSSGPALAAVADASPPSEYAGYACRIPGSWKSASTVTLKWRFHNATAQIDGDQKVVEWRITYNSPGTSGVISAAGTAAPTNTLDTDQAVNTIKTQSITLSNIAADDLLNVTISVDNGSTTAIGDIIVLDCPWIEITQAGVPDTGSAS